MTITAKHLWMTSSIDKKIKCKMAKLAHIVKNNTNNQVYILQKHNVTGWDNVTAIVGVYQNEAEAIKAKDSLSRHSNGDYRFFITNRYLEQTA